MNKRTRKLRKLAMRATAAFLVCVMITTLIPIASLAGEIYDSVSSDQEEAGSHENNTQSAEFNMDNTS